MRLLLRQKKSLGPTERKAVQNLGKKTGTSLRFFPSETAMVIAQCVGQNCTA